MNDQQLLLIATVFGIASFGCLGSAWILFLLKGKQSKKQVYNDEHE